MLGRLVNSGLGLCSRGLRSSAALGAGHAHWQNVAKDKAKGDKMKGFNAQRYVRMIERERRRGGSMDPETNGRLKGIITAAHAAGVSGETVKRTLKRLESLTTDIHNVSVIGPSGSFLLVQFYTEDRLPKCERTVTKWIRKTDPMIFRLGGASVLDNFEEKGIILTLQGYSAAEEKSKKANQYVEESRVELGKKISLEEAADVAIEVEAEDVTESEDDEGRPAFEFITDSLHLSKVEERLREAGIAVISAEPGFIPFVRVDLSSEERELSQKLASTLLELDEVIKIYSNIRQPGN